MKKMMKKFLAVLVIACMLVCCTGYAYGGSELIGSWVSSDIGALMASVMSSMEDLEDLGDLLSMMDISGTLNFTFYADGTYESLTDVYVSFFGMGESKQDSAEGTWSVSDNQLIMDGNAMTYSISGDTLTMNDGSITLQFTRTREDAEAVPAEDAEEWGFYPYDADDSSALIGSWVSSDIGALMASFMGGMEELEDLGDLLSMMDISGTITFTFHADGTYESLTDVYVSFLGMGESSQDSAEGTWSVSGNQLIMDENAMTFSIIGDTLTLNDGSITLEFTRTREDAAVETVTVTDEDTAESFDWSSWLDL